MQSNPTFREARDFLLAKRGDYEAAYRDFRWPQPEQFNWALDYFDVEAKDNDRPALWLVEEDGSETRLSYAQLSRRSNQVANFLRAQGVKRGDRILVMLPNHVALWETLLAAMKLGAVTIPATMLLTPEDIADRFERGHARHIVAWFAETGKFAAADASVTRIVVGGDAPGWTPFAATGQTSDQFTPDGPTRARDPMLLYFTSGTTSKPKLVMHSHASYPIGHLSTMFWIGLRPGDIHYNISSPGWAKHAWSCFFAPLNAGATIFVYNYARFNGAAVLDTLVRCGVTSLCAPPTVWRMLVQEDLKRYPVKLTSLVGAGEPLNPEIIARVRAAWDLTIRDGYGQTETTVQCGNTVGAPLKPGSMGRPMPGYRLALLDLDGNEVQEGEISIALDPWHPALMLGYENDARKTADITHGGFYRTGDVAARDGDGYYTYVGRTDDVFKSSDYRISPFELESALIEHPAVAEAAVVPSPDPVRLSVPKAFIALRAGYTPSPELAADIFAFIGKNLAPYKRVRRLQFYDLPKTLSGKIRRIELRKHEQSAAADAPRGVDEYWEQDFTGE